MQRKNESFHDLVDAIFYTILMIFVLFVLASQLEEKEPVVTYCGQEYTTEDYFSMRSEMDANETLEKENARELSETIVHARYQEESTTRQVITLDFDERLLLAKIAMAEAESECIICKALVIGTVLNRVESDRFPDSIREVLYQKNQFTPVQNGRFDSIEPNEDCYEALRLIEEGYVDLMGATYFEATSDCETWHSRNLEKLVEHCGTTFYKERDTE